MDPLTIAGLAGKIVESCAVAALNLRQIIGRWKDAPKMLESIAGECASIHAEMEIMQRRLGKLRKCATEDKKNLEVLGSCLKLCLHSVEALRKNTSDMYKENGGDLHRWKRFKQAFDNTTLKECRDDLQRQCQNAHRLFYMLDS